MNANGDLAGTQFCGSHLVCIAPNNVGKNLALARSEKAVVPLQFGEFRSLLSCGLVNANRVVDRVFQYLLAEWFREELYRTGLHRAHRRRDIPMTRNENN